MPLNFEIGLFHFIFFFWLVWSLKSSDLNICGTVWMWILFDQQEMSSFCVEIGAILVEIITKLSRPELLGFCN